MPFQHVVIGFHDVCCGIGNYAIPFFTYLTRFF